MTSNLVMPIDSGRSDKKGILKHPKPSAFFPEEPTVTRHHRCLESNMFCNHYRFFVLVLGLLCLTSIFSNMITINFTLICMDPKVKTSLIPEPLIVDNNISLSASKDLQDELIELSKEVPTLLNLHHYTQYQKTVLQWSVAITSFIATFPFSWLCTQYGARITFFVSGMLSALSTVLIPAAANFSFTAFIMARVIQGVSYACDFAVIGVLCTRWASLHENAKFLGVLTCFSPLASVLTNSFSGVICEAESLGWAWVHYFHGIVSAVLFLAWLVFYSDDPATSRFVTAAELKVIHSGKSEAHRALEPFVPYTAICKDKVIWTVWLNSYADLFSGTFLLIYAPTYINNVLRYSASETGFLGAFVAVSHVPMKIVCGYASDTFNCISEGRKLRLFNSVALLLPAIIYFYLCYAPADQPMVTVLMFGLVHAALGFNCGGFYKCGALVSRQYAEFVIACSQLIKCTVFFVAPAMVAIFVDDDSNAGQWHIIFYMISGMLVVSNVVFCVYATDEPREFTKITKKTKRQSVKN